ncbi:hypothetical protein ABH931_001372 [Streptacidiphilus sp. MAP12-33]|uniref:hypothetical protein n=1 Tax=Streptacidiphilus sp. MAP12-33 TaxID=3156266 RepID=UPI003519D3ED
MLLAIDTQSDAYHAGQMAAPILMGAVALAVLWAATRNWRRPQPERIPEDIEEATQLGRARTRKVALASLAIVVGAIGLDVVQDIASGGQYGSAASKGPDTVTITAPASLDDYQLMTGTTADQLRTQLQGKVSGDLSPQHVLNFYSGAGAPTRPVLIVVTDTSAVDSRLAADLDAHSADNLNADFMAGGQVSRPQVFPLGTDGNGEMQCGQNTEETICQWTDAGSQGVLVTALNNGISVQDLATLTARFRTAAEG